VSRFHGVDSEVGTLRTVIVHRPGAELKRVLPRDTGQLLFAQLPWAVRAQQEHDMFTQVLRDHGVQVLYLTELLQDKKMKNHNKKRDEIDRKVYKQS